MWFQVSGSRFLVPGFGFGDYDVADAAHEDRDVLSNVLHFDVRRAQHDERPDFGCEIGHIGEFCSQQEASGGPCGEIIGETVAFQNFLA